MYIAQPHNFLFLLNIQQGMIDILLATPLWLLKMAYFFLPTALLDIGFLHRFGVTNNFFETLNISLEHPLVPVLCAG